LEEEKKTEGIEDRAIPSTFPKGGQKFSNPSAAGKRGVQTRNLKEKTFKDVDLAPKVTCRKGFAAHLSERGLLIIGLACPQVEKVTE